MRVANSKVSMRRREKLVKALRTVEDLRQLFAETPPTEAELIVLITAEIRREEGPRRSVLKRLHGNYNRVRGANEWAELEAYLQ